MIRKIKIYDLDGTLINSLHRYKTNKAGDAIDLEYWIKNDVPEKIANDSFLFLKSRLDIDLIDKTTYVIFATARSCIEGDANYQFLIDNNIVPDMFIHRMGRNDMRGGAQLKLDSIKPLLNLKQFKNATVHIFEDNINYLYDMVTALNKGVHYNKVVGHFIPSEQGH